MLASQGGSPGNNGQVDRKVPLALHPRSESTLGAVLTTPLKAEKEAPISHRAFEHPILGMGGAGRGGNLPTSRDGRDRGRLRWLFKLPPVWAAGPFGTIPSSSYRSTFGKLPPRPPRSCLKDSMFHGAGDKSVTACPGGHTGWERAGSWASVTGGQRRLPSLQNEGEGAGWLTSREGGSGGCTEEAGLGCLGPGTCGQGALCPWNKGLR